jgi:phospholipase C
MSTCTKWVDTIVITCKNWSSQVDYECTDWADEGSSQCSQWADEGSNQCSQWADEGSNQCSSWGECHWYTPWSCIAGFFCRAWYWVAKWICKAWYWIAKWVCKAWYWVAKWVCKAFAWVVKTFCVLFSWAFKLVCVAWDTLRCALLNIARSISLLFSKGRRPKAKIEHVFVLMMENRSFDHMLGFSGIAGVDPDGNPTIFNDGFDPNVNSNFDPLTSTFVKVNHPADFQLKDIDKDPGHEFENTLTVLSGSGAVYNPVPGGYPPINCSGFIENYWANGSTDGSSTPQRIMNCYDPDQVPGINTLAREFTICDQWFSSLPGPTWPNRFFLLAATSGGLDGSPDKLDVVTSTTVEGYRFSNGNFFDLLDQYCIKWRIFEGDDFPVSFAMSGMNLNELQGRFKEFDDFASEVNKASFNEKFIFIEPKYGEHEFDVTGPGDFACGNSQHPLDDITRGERLIKNVYEAIRNSPHWENSLLLVTWDEHGGFYDHVVPPGANSVPPVVPPGDLITQSYVQHHFQFDQLGVRVPAIVISPYTKKGVIDHTTYDHTSMVATFERLFGLTNLTNRDKSANDFLHLLPLTSPRTDAPTSLNVAVNPDPLPCEEDDESVDQLLVKRSALRIAKQEGMYRERAIAEMTIPSTTVGFLQVALLKVLQTAQHPERAEWIEQYKDIHNKVDAAIFMTEAKLKIRYAIDFKTYSKEARRQERIRRLRKLQ